MPPDGLRSLGLSLFQFTGIWKPLVYRTDSISLAEIAINPVLSSDAGESAAR